MKLRSMMFVGLLGLGSLGAATTVMAQSTGFKPYKSPYDYPGATSVYSSGMSPRAKETTPGYYTPKPFETYKPASVYSSRGGLDSYQRPAKPKGYVDIYGVHQRNSNGW